MERPAILVCWILVIISDVLLCSVVTAKKGHSNGLQHPNHKAGGYNHKKDLLKSLTSHDNTAGKKGIIQAFEDPEVTVTVTKTQYVTVTVKPGSEPSKLCHTTTKTLTQYAKVFTEAPTVTETATTQTTVFETATTLKYTPTDTKTTTKVVNTQATTSLTTQTVHVTTATTEVETLDTSTVMLTLTTPLAITTTVTATQTPTPVVLVEEKIGSADQVGKKRYIGHQRYRRIRRSSWYTKIIPNFVKKWMGIE